MRQPGYKARQRPRDDRLQQRWDAGHRTSRPRHRRPQRTPPIHPGPANRQRPDAAPAMSLPLRGRPLPASRGATHWPATQPTCWRRCPRPVPSFSLPSACLSPPRTRSPHMCCAEGPLGAHEVELSKNPSREAAIIPHPLAQFRLCIQRCAAGCGTIGRALRFRRRVAAKIDLPQFRHSLWQNCRTQFSG